MDPFVVISFGKKVFWLSDIHLTQSGTRNFSFMFVDTKRHSKFSSLSSNNYIGDASFSLKDLVDSAPQPDPVTGLYNEKDEDHQTSEYELPLEPAKETPWEAKYKPVITFQYAFLCLALTSYLLHPSTLRRPAKTFLAPVFEAVRHRRYKHNFSS